MKKWISLLIIVMVCCVSFKPVNATQSIQLHSQYAYLIDLKTRQVYIDLKSDERIYPASMTKILTVSLALEKIQDINEKVTIIQDDLAGLYEQGASVAGFYAGEVVTYKDLIYGAMLPSGADACQALSRMTYGGTDQMVKAMNQRVDDLKLKHTHFMNVTGLHDEQHYTTVKEMSVILEEALKNPVFVEAFQARTYEDSSMTRQWPSILKRGEIARGLDIRCIDGAKSGFTDEAQLTLASTMTIDEHPLILVTAYAKGQYNFAHVEDAISVYKWMNEKYHQVVIYKKDDDIGDIWIFKSMHLPYHYCIDQDLSLLLDRSIEKDDLDVDVNYQKYLFADIKQGTMIGHIEISYQGKDMYQYPLVINENIQADLLGSALFYGVMIGVPACLCLIIIYMLKKKK